MTDVSMKRQQGGNIYEAHRQWASRPADQIYPTIAAMHEFCSQVRAGSFEGEAPLSSCSIYPAGHDDLRLIIPEEGECEFTNFSFKQFCSMIGAPAEHYASLPGHIVETPMNYLIKENLEKDKVAKILFFNDNAEDRLFIRAATSKVYDRLWNSDVTEFLTRLNPDKIKLAKSASDATGLYASDHDMFAFLLAKETYLDIPGTELVRGFYIMNNEVGTGSLTFCGFLCDYVCGNHIIWNVKDSFQLNVRHVGTTANTVFTEVIPQAVAITMLAGAKAQEERIRNAQAKMLGPSKEEVVNFVFEKNIATRKFAEAAYDYATVRHDETGFCEPNSAWGMVSGLTHEAKQVPYYDQRAQAERAASKLLELVA